MIIAHLSLKNNTELFIILITWFKFWIGMVHKMFSNMDSQRIVDYKE